MSARRVHLQLDRTAAQIFAVSERLNQMLLEELDREVWSVSRPGGVRTISSIFTHLHNVRCKWVRLSAPDLAVPARLNRARTTPEQARAGLAESAARCVEMLDQAFDGEGGGKMFRRDGWATPWPIGMEMLCYMLAHEAHHRGQICLLTRQLGFPLAKDVIARMWSWERLRD